MRRTIPLLALLCTAALASEKAPTPSQPDLGLDLTLVDATFQDVGGRKNPSSISLYLRRVGGSWQPVIGFAARLNACFHSGFVEETSLAADQIKLKIAMDIPGDPWVPGGWGLYTVTLTKGKGSVWRGTYEGSFRRVQLKGTAEAEQHSAPKQLQPPAAGAEHPRLLFRKADVPALRKKLETPFGKAAVARMTNAPGLAVRYAINGDKALAEAAREKAAAILADTGSGSKRVAHRVWGWRMIALAITYDCCHDAWSEDFRSKVRDWLTHLTERVLFQHQSWTEYTGWNLGHRFGANLMGAASVASLVLDGEPGPAPLPPAAYLGGHDAQKPMPVMNGNAPADASTFKPGVVPSVWNWIGGLHPKAGEDVLKMLGGPKQALLGAPRKITVGGKSFTTGPLPKEAYRNGGVDIVKANKHNYFSENWFSTVLKVSKDQEQWFRYDAGFDAGINDPMVWMNGTRIYHDDVFRLGPGTYALLIKAPIARTNPWGMIQIRPKLVALEESEAKARLAHRLKISALRKARHEQDLAYHRNNANASARYHRNFVYGEALAHAIFRHTIREGGFQAGYYELNFLLENLFRYPCLYRNARGRGLNSFGDITHYLPRCLFSMIYPQEGHPAVQRINGRCDLGVKDWYDPDRDAAPEIFACLYPIVSENLKPGLLHTWNRHMGIASEKDAEKALKSNLGGNRHDVKWGALDAHPVFAFVNYPLDAKPKTSQEAWPRTWEAKGLGWYAMRNRFQDKDDFVTQVFAKTRPGFRWDRENAGVIRVRGLGQDWWIGPADSKTDRFFESVPVLPEKTPTNPRGVGRVVHSGFEKDGSSTISVDLSDLFATPVMTAKGKPAQYASVYGCVRNPESVKPSGVKALRAVGVDYSGKSGAPCLLVVVDRMQGGAQPKWRYLLDAVTEKYGRWEILDPKGKTVSKKNKKKLFQKGLPKGYRFQVKKYKEVKDTYEPAATAKLAISGNSFTVTKGDATMRGTMIANGDVQLREEKKAEMYKKFGFKGAHNVFRKGSWGVAATGCDTYLCVMTIQRGEAPAVKVDGKGVAAMIRVGKQTVRFDGEKVMFGE